MFIQVHCVIMKNRELNKIKQKKSIWTDVLLLKLIIGFFLILIVFYSLTPVYILEARNFETGKILKQWILKEELFIVAYTHSVMLSEVTETYKVKDGKIILIESTFKDFGAGLPATTPYDFKIDEKTGVFKIFNINQEIKPLIYRTGTERANHKLILNNKEYEFLSFSKAREGVEFVIKKENIFRNILN